MHQLQIDGLTKTYGETLAVDDLSFTVEPGRVTGFLGPNGAGKSTTIKVLLDLASADGGTATIGGSRYRDLDDASGTVGVLLEQDAFHPGRSGRNHLRVVAAGAGIDDARVPEALSQVGLTEAGDQKVGEYSLGMRQRLGLATALLGDPPVLVLDEPANGLDPQGVRWLRELLRWRADQGHTVFVSSHLLGEMQQLADEVVIVDRGRLIDERDMDQLATGAVRVRTPDGQQLADALRTEGAQVEAAGDGALIVQDLEAPRVGELAHRAGVVLHELSPQVASLEELFLSVTADRAADDPGGST